MTNSVQPKHTPFELCSFHNRACCRFTLLAISAISLGVTSGIIVFAITHIASYSIVASVGIFLISGSVGYFIIKVSRNGEDLSTNLKSSSTPPASCEESLNKDSHLGYFQSIIDFINDSKSTPQQVTDNFYDPSLKISKEQCLQRALLIPRLSNDQKDSLVHLLYEELNQQRASIDSDFTNRVISLLKYLDSDTIGRFKNRINDGTDVLLYQAIHYHLKESKRFIRAQLLRQKIIGDSQLLVMTVDNGACFYHSLAIALSLGFKKTITIQEICKKLFNSLSQDEALKKLCNDVSIDTYLDNLATLSKKVQATDIWAIPEIDCKLISKIYGIKVVVLEGLFFKEENGNLVEDDHSLIIIEKSFNVTNSTSLCITLVIADHHVMPLISIKDISFS